jgi:hypothetical protein
VYSSAQLPAAVTSLEVITGAGSQLSVAVADPVNVGVVPDVQSITVSTGQTITGRIVSWTVMIW